MQCKDQKCCPPENSRFNSSKDYRLYHLNKEYNYSISMLVIFFVLFIILTGFIIYFGFFLFKKINKYFQEKRKKEQNKSQILNQNFQKYVNNNNDNYNSFYDRFYDDENKNNKSENEFLKSIEKSIEKFKLYNFKISRFFKSNYDKETPDVIDKRILNEEFDNW